MLRRLHTAMILTFVTATVTLASSGSWFTHCTDPTCTWKASGIGTEPRYKSGDVCPRQGCKGKVIVVRQ